MNDTMISEYRAWLERHVRTCDQGESDGRAMLKMCLREFNEAVARHEATEPLACLAGSRGFSMRIGSNEKGVWFISLRKGHNTREQITGPTYGAAEAAARKVLENLPDREGK